MTPKKTLKVRQYHEDKEVLAYIKKKYPKRMAEWTRMWTRRGMESEILTAKRK